MSFFCILQPPFFSTLSVLCSCFQPTYFFLRFLLRFSSHFVSFTHWEEFSNTGFSSQFQKRQMWSSHPHTLLEKPGKKKCPQCFTTNMAPFKHQLLSVRSVFIFFLCTDRLLNFIPALFSFAKYWKEIGTPSSSNWQIFPVPRLYKHFIAYNQTKHWHKWGWCLQISSRSRGRTALLGDLGVNQLWGLCWQVKHSLLPFLRLKTRYTYSKPAFWTSLRMLNKLHWIWPHYCYT